MNSILHQKNEELKVLIVSSGNSGIIPTFVEEQALELAKLNVEIQHFLIKGNGAYGYLKNRSKLLNAIQEFAPDIIHAHYGLSGLLANLQRIVPVITTYHGSDINDKFPFLLSKLTMFLSKFNIFVSKKLAIKAKAKHNFSIVACGIDMSLTKVVDKDEAIQIMHLQKNTKNILFSASFDNKNKNYKLAKAAIDLLLADSIAINLIELKGYSREKVNLLMNAVDCILVTSLKESGPLVIKEAMAVNNLAVSVDVGDVSEVFGNLKGYYISTYTPKDIAENIKLAFNFPLKTRGRDRIKELGLDSKTVALKILSIYQYVINNRKQNHNKTHY